VTQTRRLPEGKMTERRERSEEEEEQRAKKVLPHHKLGQACVFSQRIVYWLASLPRPILAEVALYWVAAWMHD